MCAAVPLMLLLAFGLPFAPAFAREAASDPELEEALDLLEQALKLAPDHDEAQSRRRKVREALERQIEEKKSRAVAQALTDIQAALKAEDFDTASELLAELA